MASKNCKVCGVAYDLEFRWDTCSKECARTQITILMLTKIATTLAEMSRRSK